MGVLRIILILLTLAHDLVDFAILLTTDEFLMLISQLDLHSHLVWCSFDKRNLIDHHHGGFDGIIGSVNSEG